MEEEDDDDDDDATSAKVRLGLFWQSVSLEVETGAMVDCLAGFRLCVDDDDDKPLCVCFVRAAPLAISTTPPSLPHSQDKSARQWQRGPRRPNCSCRRSARLVFDIRRGASSIQALGCLLAIDRAVDRVHFLTTICKCVAQAGVVEMADLGIHEKFLARLVVSSLNLLRTIAEEKECAIEDLNAGKIVDWFVEDAEKRSKDVNSATLKW